MRSPRLVVIDAVDDPDPDAIERWLRYPPPPDKPVQRRDGEGKGSKPYHKASVRELKPTRSK